jgi:serine protease inhibitor ecotin
VECTPLYSWVENYYTTDPVSAASSTMAKCSFRGSFASSFSFVPNVGRKLA